MINLWGFGEKTEQRAIPSEAELKAARQKTGCQHLSVTDQNELIKDIPDLTINLSAVAKGFGVDEMARVLRGHGLTNYYAAIAGEVMVGGTVLRDTKWQVGISAPVAHWNETDPMAAVAALSNQAISTSGRLPEILYRSPRPPLESHHQPQDWLARTAPCWRRLHRGDRQHDGGCLEHHLVCAGRRPG